MMVCCLSRRTPQSVPLTELLTTQLEDVVVSVRRGWRLLQWELPKIFPQLVLREQMT